MRVAPLDPGLHDLSGQPVSAEFCFYNDGHAVVEAEWIGATCEKEGCDVGVKGAAGLDVAVVLRIEGVTEQSPAITVVVFDIVTRIQQIP